jgi:hypothetical protein
MSLMNTKGVGSVCYRSREKREPRQVFRLTDHIPEEIQEVIWIWYKEGVTRRQMSQRLLDMDVESPPMVVPWGDNAIRAVLDKYKRASNKANS